MTTTVPNSKDATTSSMGTTTAPLGDATTTTTITNNNNNNDIVAVAVTAVQPPPHFKNPKYDTTVVALTALYTLLIILLFALPYRIGNDDNGDGWSDLAAVLGVILLAGGGALILSIVIVSMAACRWRQLSTYMKVLSFYPLVGIFFIILVISLIVSIRNKNGYYDTDDDYNTGIACPDGIGCKDPYWTPSSDGGNMDNSTFTDSDNNQVRHWLRL